MAEDWQVQGVRDALKRAADIGETRTSAALQREVGVGSGDLDEVLRGLLGEGAVQQVATDEYELMRDDVAAERRGSVLAAIDEDEHAGADGAAPLPAGMLPPHEARTLLPSPPPETVLTRAMVQSLGDEPLGALVKAGMEGANGEFVLRVRP